ncbi:serine/threonine protein phosphatase 2A 55 kDa regulatory subunit B beta isoform-like [Neltuma alba]|uniref:serine/threonine protein phosphatase 2A 55 kDa regulatory subunit B beta isoform-like n=1 Tax=Neltuma alba TaxID=207710 RepID=UPI0010A3CA82|nr:serine/threonine protein phosphatase 2A 55 kDa regulatory subunit B beta isoform-like [Prosopis alba]
MLHSSAPLQWSFSQILGHRSPSDHHEQDDIITAIEFDKRGDYVAIGDQGGRVVIFERDDQKNVDHQYSRKLLEQVDCTPSRNPKFQFKLQFQSHQPEIDYLANEKITPRIKKVKWCITQNGLLFMLSANDKIIKLWKIKECKTGKTEELVPSRFLSSENLSERSFLSGQDTLSSADGCRLEWMENMSCKDSLSQNINAKIVGVDNNLHAKCRKVYAPAHSFNINSISNNSDGEIFISADDFKINLWNLEVSDQCFNIINMKPSNMEHFAEIITSAEFHPSHCNLLAYGSSSGFIRLSDLRQSARCDHSVRMFVDGSLFCRKSVFEEMTTCISDVKFLDDGLGGQQLISRDYMNMKLWDMRMDYHPVALFRIHEHLRPRLPELFSNKLIFDRFDCCFSGDRLHFATGSYGNLLRIFSPANGTVKDIKLDTIGIIDRKPFQADGMIRRSSISNLTCEFGQNGGGRDGHLDCNLSSKLLHVAGHPTSNLVACAAQRCLILYHA